MAARLPILMLLMLSLVLGPTRMMGRCEPVAKVHAACGHCCEASKGECCVAGKKSEPQESPVSIATQSVDGKQMVSPVWFFICAAPQQSAGARLVPRELTAQMSGRSRVEVTCIRLI